MNRVRGLNVVVGNFIVPDSMLDNVFVVDPFVSAANNMGQRPRCHQSNNNQYNNNKGHNNK
ncbi:hypothetical protein A2U01_0077342 [Trifolium medium]|uniref:Uncharacterized protein n=1 Tax=Trifolium medium TaxID=97028 RepID=A0A392T4P6_9FABA|nr:hypothetical protein [Trifolium medium]